MVGAGMVVIVESSRSMMVRDQDDAEDQPRRRGQPGCPVGRLRGHVYRHQNLLWRAGLYGTLGEPGRVRFTDPAGCSGYLPCWAGSGCWARSVEVVGCRVR